MYDKPNGNYGRYDLQKDFEKRGTIFRGSYTTTRISLWDIAAGVLFVKEAGGDILHFDGVPYKWSEFEANKNYDLIASNGKIRIGF